MSADPATTRKGLWSAAATLLATSSTLVCCALPALLVALGAGAALSALVAAAPQVVWLSEHKEALFGVCGAALVLSGAVQWQQRSAPCPVEPHLRRACMRTRAAARRLYAASVATYLVGGWFAFVQPLLA